MAIPDVVCGPDGTLGSDIADRINSIKTLAESAHKLYWFYSGDTATDPDEGGTKITHTANATDTFLTNNAAGSLTNEYNPSNFDNVWNPLTNKFDFTSLKAGDIFNIRVDLKIDHAAAQEINLVFDLAENAALPYTQNISHDYYVTATDGVIVTAFFETPLFSQSVIDNSARIRFVSKGAATITVQGFYYKITSVDTVIP
jgi:hypothetical protein